MDKIHKLVKDTRAKILAGNTYMDDSTLYFTVDSDELFLGSHKIGSAFVYVDDEHPLPEKGVPGYIYINRYSYDINIWDENAQKWVYMGCAGDNNVSLKNYTEFKDYVNNKLIDMAKIIYVINEEDLPNPGKPAVLYIVKETGKSFIWADNKYIMLAGDGGGSSSGGHSDTADRLSRSVNISVDGDVSGSAAFDESQDITIHSELSNTGTAEGTFNNDEDKVTPITVDLKGRIVSVGEKVPISVDWEKVKSKPTTLEGYGITDAIKDPSGFDGTLIFDCGDSSDEE